MSKTTADFQDSAYQTSEMPRYSLIGTIVRKFSVTKSPKESELILSGRYSRATDGAAEVIVNMNSGAVARSLQAKRINRNLAGDVFAESEMRSDVYSND